MRILIGAFACAVLLALIFILPALAYLWTLDSRLEIDEHDPDFPAIRGPVIYPIPEAAPNAEPPNEVATTLRPSRAHDASPTLSPSTTKESVEPLRSYADRKKINQNHELLIINPKS
jgi:hypothetical protein